VLTALAIAHPFAHGFGWGFPFALVLIPLFWIGVIVLIVALSRRRWRRMGAAGWGGPWGGPWAGHGGWASQQAARSAESTLAERFAQGDIDEVEYRARLEVLRANAAPPVPPQA
jgi:putative membrane protein